MIVLVTSDRGLCGGFNASTARAAIKIIKELGSQGKQFQITTVGKKGLEAIGASKYSDFISDTYLSTVKNSLLQARRISDKLLEKFDNNEFDVCTLIYNRFVSSITQEVTTHQLIPYTPPGETFTVHPNLSLHALYDYEPSEERLLADLLPKNLAVQIFRSLLQSMTSEYGARMTAMDSATRNADEMIKNLNLQYNRMRQSMVTRELIEIISGAEAL